MIERRAQSRRAAEAMVNQGKVAAWVRVTAVALAAYVVVVLTVASVIGVVNAVTAADAAKEARDLGQSRLEVAEEVRRIAVELKSTTEGVEAILAHQAPCDPGDPPETPGCQRQARTDALIADAVRRIVAKLEASVASHDAAARRDHEALRRTLAPPATPTSTTTSTTTTTAQPPGPRVGPIVVPGGSS